MRRMTKVRNEKEDASKRGTKRASQRQEKKE